MNRVLLALALVMAFPSLATAQPDPPVQADPNPQQPVPQPQIQPDTPENAARLFVRAASLDDEFQLSMMVAGARIGYFGNNEWANALSQGYPRSAIANRTIDSVEVVDKPSEDVANVAIKMHWERPNMNGQNLGGEPQKYLLQLRRETLETMPVFQAPKTFWRVVPPPIEDVLAKPLDQTPPLQLTAAIAARDPRLLSYLQLETGTVQERATNQLKQLGLGVAQFVQDYELIFALDDAAHERALRPYVKKDSLFTIPETKSEKWHFNDNLSEKSFAKLNDSSKVVLFYDGDAPDSEHLNFRFDGKTAICFADGHAAALSKDEARVLVWKP